MLKNNASGPDVASGKRILFERLRRALGLTGLATLTMASGPCGSCPDEYNACNSISELIQKRVQAFPAAAADAGAVAGAGGAASRDYREEIAMSWDPEKGCPNSAQWNAITGNFDSSVQKPESGTDTCCYRVQPDCPGGRPFLVAGEARRPALFGAAEPNAESLSEALAASYAHDGLMEYASVAAFARLTLGLMALGAPNELIRNSQLASLDELRHAEFCFAQAAGYTGRTFAAGPLAMDSALDDVSLEWLIESNIIEGCIGETLAATRVTEQARHVTAPALRHALLTIAEDETRHAELAWKVLGWALEVAPVVTREIVARVLSAWRFTTSPECRFADDPRWNGAGRLTAAQAARIDRETFQETLLPLFEELRRTRDTIEFRRAQVQA